MELLQQRKQLELVGKLELLQVVIGRSWSLERKEIPQHLAHQVCQL
jgi:hypothetical protein